MKKKVRAEPISVVSLGAVNSYYNRLEKPGKIRELKARLAAEEITRAEFLAREVKIKRAAKDFTKWKRRLVAALDVCRELKKPPPEILTSAIAICMGVRRGPEHRVKRQAECKAAAKYLAANPSASNRAVARAIGMAPDSWGHSQIGMWTRQAWFQREIKKERKGLKVLK